MNVDAVRSSGHLKPAASAAGKNGRPDGGKAHQEDQPAAVYI